MAFRVFYYTKLKISTILASDKPYAHKLYKYSVSYIFTVIIVR